MDLSAIGNWFKNTGSTIGNKLKTGYNTYAPRVGNYISQNRDIILGGLGGLGLGALNNANQKNLIKASYYKNPYLTAALTPEYSLNDNINNLVGLLGMYGSRGQQAGDVDKAWNLFKSSLTRNGNNFTSEVFGNAYDELENMKSLSTPRYRLANEAINNNSGDIFGDISDKVNDLNVNFGY